MLSSQVRGRLVSVKGRFLRPEGCFAVWSPWIFPLPVGARHLSKRKVKGPFPSHPTHLLALLVTNTSRLPCFLSACNAYKAAERHLHSILVTVAVRMRVSTVLPRLEVPLVLRMAGAEPACMHA